MNQLSPKKKSQGAGQEWYDTFTTIVNSITLTTPSITAASSNWSVYKNQKYGFEISYPKSYKALDSKSDLYGYQKGVVLLYKGGQAYDVVIEVWNSPAEYESNYGPRMSDVTVIKDNGKYITLLNNTQESENKEVISSFQLSP